jgi:zinc protease
VVNGSTWYDRTNYFETVPANYLSLGLWLESDRMGFLLPAMTEEKLEKQRQVVMNERRQRVDNQPYGQAMERLFELLFPTDHPYHWPVIGYMEDIAAATLEDVREFFRTYYTPNNAVLTLAGSLQPDQALEEVELYFGSLPRGPEPPPVSASLAPLGGEQRLDVEDAVQLPRVYMAYRAPSIGEPGWYDAAVLATIWAEGKSSLLYDDLVYRRQIAQDVTTFLFPTEEVATLLLIATARPGVEIQEVEKALDEHVQASREQELDEEHLDRAKNQVVTELFGEIEQLHRRADLLSQFTTFHDDPSRVSGEAQRYRAVTPERIRAFANRYCRPEDRAVVTILPKAKP